MTVHVLVPRLHERRSRGPLAIPVAVPQGLPDEERGLRSQSRRCRNGRCLACPRGPAAHDRLTRRPPRPAHSRPKRPHPRRRLHPRHRPHYRSPRLPPAPPPRPPAWRRCPTMTVLLSPVLTLSRRLRPLDPARTPLQASLRGTCPPSPERDPVTFTITRWGAGRAVTKIVDAIVGYLQPPHPRTLRCDDRCLIVGAPLGW